MNIHSSDDGKNNCSDYFNNINKTEIKESDFSIDHILNRAGDKCTNLENCTHCPKISLSEISLGTPQLRWLQYTRYHPPKQSRAFGHMPTKRTAGRLPRIPFTPIQLSILEDAYKTATYLSSEDASKLAEKLNLTCNRVKIWFQNRRARERRERKTNQSAEINYTNIKLNINK